MTPHEYENFVMNEEARLMTARPLTLVESNVLMLSNAMAGEAGEVANEVKKLFRDYLDVMPGDQLPLFEKIAFEAGDVLWYLTRLLNFIGYNLEEVMQMNVDKLRERRAQRKTEALRAPVGRLGATDAPCDVEGVSPGFCSSRERTF